MRTFQPYSLMHALVLAVFFGTTAAAIGLGRRWRGSRRPDLRRAAALDRAMGGFVLVLWITFKTWALWPANYVRESSFPLQLCDYTALAAALSLLTGLRFFRALVYFWGLGLSTQGFITPDLQQGPGRPKFWFFWLSHGAIVGTALYDILARGFRPTWRDYWVAIGTLAVYFVIVLPIDVWFGLNYGYVGKGQPTNPSLIDHLGPWPGRVVVIALLVLVVLALLQLPWEVARRVRRLRGTTGEDAATGAARVGLPGGKAGEPVT